MRLERILQAAANSLKQGKRKAHCGDYEGDVQKDIRNAQSDVESFQFASEYGEPGYDNPKKGIVFSNWNHFPRGLDNILERAGYAVEWEDEWYIAYETGKAYRSSPDSYGWTPYYVMTERGDIIGGDEIESGDQAEWYIDEYLLNNPRRANVFRGFDLAKYGFRLAYPEEYDRQTGFHPGMNDKPADVLKRVRSDFPDHDVVFEISEQSQFYTSWRPWIRPVNYCPLGCAENECKQPQSCLERSK